MSSINRWIISDDSSGVDPTGMNKMDGVTMMRKCESHAGRGAQGAMACNLQMALNPVAAQATVTASGNGTAADTLTIGNVVITIEASGAVGGSNQVNVGTAGTGVDLAAAIAALINGSPSTFFTGTSSSFVGICTASAASGVLTLTAAIPGTIGNGLQLAKSSSALALTHLWGASVAGSEGTSKTFPIGK
jgi:phage tail sheath gpL-like